MTNDETHWEGEPPGEPWSREDPPVQAREDARPPNVSLFGFPSLFRASSFGFRHLPAVLALFAAFVLFALANAEAQKPLRTIPFQRGGQLITVQVSIDKHPPVSFVVDTGAPHTILDPKFAKELGLKISDADPASGTDAGDVTKSHRSPITMTLHDVPIDVPQPSIIDLTKVPIPQPANGLVGAEIFAKYVVRMDPLRSTFSVFDPVSFKYTGDGASIPLIVASLGHFCHCFELPHSDFVISQYE